MLSTYLNLLKRESGAQYNRDTANATRSNSIIFANAGKFKLLKMFDLIKRFSSSQILQYYPTRD